MGILGQNRKDLKCLVLPSCCDSQPEAPEVSAYSDGVDVYATSLEAVDSQHRLLLLTD